MIDLKALQKRIYQNKVNKKFNTTNIPLEFSLIHEETSEAFHAYYTKDPKLGEELADIVIYVLGLSQILNINLEEELSKKVAKNEKRQYKRVNGILTKLKD